jgi:hypothetical protein
MFICVMPFIDLDYVLPSTGVLSRACVHMLLRALFVFASCVCDDNCMSVSCSNFTLLLPVVADVDRIYIYIYKWRERGVRGKVGLLSLV